MYIFVFKHNLELSYEADFLRANSELYFLLHAFFGFEGIRAKVRALFVKKCNFFYSKLMLTSLIALEHFS